MRFRCQCHIDCAPTVRNLKVNCYDQGNRLWSARSFDSYVMVEHESPVEGRLRGEDMDDGGRSPGPANSEQTLFAAMSK